MKTGISAFALLLGALAVPASAQTGSGRADEARQGREAKAAATAPYRPGRVERVLTMVETNGTIQRLFTPHDGFGVRIGGISGGSWMAAGPAWRKTTLDGSLQLNASGTVSMTRDTDLEAALTVPQVGTRWLALAVKGAATHLDGERFFGLGPDSDDTHETRFASDYRSVGVGATLTPFPWWTVGTTTGLTHTGAGDGASRRAPAISTRFADREAPGLALDAAFRTVSIATTFDYRDVPKNPRRGGRYHLAVGRYADRAAGRHSFTRVDAELEQHLSAWKRQRVVSLRLLASSTFADTGHTVPFYLQPTLGGSQWLRGFVGDRFRDRSVLALQADYGWDLTPFLSAVAFYELGTVAPRLAEIDIEDFRKDYGLGLRFGSARTVAFRTDVAFGSGEGTRFTMRMSHAF